MQNNLDINGFINSAAVSGDIARFLIIFLRISIFMAMMPIFSSQNSPVQFKMGLAVAFALVITPVVNFDLGDTPIALVIMKEIVLSMLLGGVGLLVFTGVSMAGQIMSNSMSLSIATYFDPQFGQSAEMSRLLEAIVTLLFFIMNAHQDMIYIFVKSFELIPPGQIKMNNLMIAGMFGGAKLFVMAIKVGAPVMVGLLVANLLLGFLYKAAPQVNIMFVSFPIFIFFGMVLLIAGMPVFLHVVAQYIGGMKQDMYDVLQMGTR
ncbi:MAG: flagellar biosynthetic protein FliR [Nitrospirae bacterium]|nr:flagellar biosynthetic protein FliR [Nitrospirota bacterium]